MAIWRRSYPEVVAAAHDLMARHRFLEAAQQYWLAAFVAPTTEYETTMLMSAWQASERARGHVSELEGRP